MTDIYDIKDTLLGFPINITYSLIFIVIIILLFVLYKYLTRVQEEEIIEEVEEKIVIEKDFLLILKDFEKEYIGIKSDLFYSKLLEILREIYYKNENKNIESMTFDEINKLNIDKDLNDLIKSMYYKEYAKDIDDSEGVRRGFVEKVRGLVK